MKNTLCEWDKVNAKNTEKIPYLAYKYEETPNQVIRDLLTDETEWKQETPEE